VHDNYYRACACFTRPTLPPYAPQHHIAFHLPRASNETVVAEAFDFPGAVTQGFDLSDARLMIASAMKDLSECLLEPEAAAEADQIEILPLSTPG